MKGRGNIAGKWHPFLLPSSTTTFFSGWESTGFRASRPHRIFCLDIGIAVSYGAFAFSLCLYIICFYIYMSGIAAAKMVIGDIKMWMGLKDELKKKDQIQRCGWRHREEKNLARWMDRREGSFFLCNLNC